MLSYRVKLNKFPPPGDVFPKVSENPTNGRADLRRGIKKFRPEFLNGRFLVRGFVPSHKKKFGPSFFFRLRYAYSERSGVISFLFPYLIESFPGGSDCDFFQLENK